MNTGTSTLGPSAVTVPTVMTSCAAAAPARRVRRMIRALESEDIGRIPGRKRTAMTASATSRATSAHAESA